MIRSRTVPVYLLLPLFPAQVSAQSAGKILAVTDLVTLQHGTSQQRRLVARDEFAVGDRLTVSPHGQSRILLYANGARLLLAAGSTYRIHATEVQTLVGASPRALPPLKVNPLYYAHHRNGRPRQSLILGTVVNHSRGKQSSRRHAP